MKTQKAAQTDLYDHENGSENVIFCNFLNVQVELDAR